MKKLHLALFAGATALFAAAPAQATVVYVNLTATPLVVPPTIDGLYINVVTGASGASGGAVPGWDLNPYNNGIGLTFFAPTSPQGILASGEAGSSAVATSLPAGAVIGAAGQFNELQTQGTAFHFNGSEYLGFRFINESTGALNYGWALFSTSFGAAGTLGFPAALLGYAYENAGLPILAGQTVSAVPEPGTWALYGLGIAALAAWRRRQA